jgi:hypothetical protein
LLKNSNLEIWVWKICLFIVIIILMERGKKNLLIDEEKEKKFVSIKIENIRYKFLENLKMASCIYKIVGNKNSE